MNTSTKSRDWSILITDDDERCRDALREIVEPEGFHTWTASSGEEALDILHDKPIHLLMLDMHMPRLSGLETVQLVHQFQANLPCILVTGDPTESLIRQAYQSHVYSVIPKPVSKNVVIYTVLRALAKVYGSE
jgi:DNA-binding NtrC family response regulator